MVVQHNLQAMNANRMLNVNTKTQAKSTEKLSSGYKINRAADDAAGLSISEKMRKQIRGLTQASSNAQDGISAVQTAEGALNEVQDMLQRMNELAVKAANGTMSVDDRSYIQNEIDQLETEIDRVAETTKFNETYLLKGDKLSDKEFTASYTSEMTEATFEKIDPYDKFFGANSTTALTDDEILEKLNKGERIYTNPMGQSASGHSVTPGSNASVEIDLTNWGVGTSNDTLSIFGISISKTNQASASDVLDALKNDTTTTFNENYEATLDSTGKKLTITAKSNDVTANNIAGIISGSIDNGQTTNTLHDISNVMSLTERVAHVFDDKGQGWGNLYLEGATDGTAALTEAQAKQALLEGKTLYYGTINQTESVNHSYTEAKGATATIDMSNWKTGDTLTIATKQVNYTANTVASASQVADSLNGDATFSAGYKATVDGNKLIIEALDATKPESDLVTVITAVKVNGTDIVGNNATAANAAEFNKSITAPVPEKYEDNGKGWENLYKAGGTEALSADDAKAILKAGGKLYTNAATQKEAVEDVDYAYNEPEEKGFYDVNGNKISSNALDEYFEFDSAGNASLKDGKTLYVDDEGTEFGSDPTHVLTDFVNTARTKTASLSINLHVGADATTNNQISMSIEAMDTATLGIKDLKVDGADDSNALNAIETIKAALQKVSTQRSALGAVQNRLEHTINNLDNVVENTTSAESAIRDTDMASEMVKYSNNNILAQAGQSMLAQANQSNQGVLSLLG